MARRSRAALAAGLLAIALVAGVLVANTNFGRPARPEVSREIRAAVELRQSRYREIGTAFKLINDELKSSAPYLPTIRRSATQIHEYAVDLPNWFPTGSGPDTGLDMEATAAIWDRHAEFERAQRAFALRAEELEQAAAGEEFSRMREAAATLGSACRNCHDQFRDEDQ